MRKSTIVETKPRLVTFGCSNTYGQGLPDCYDKKGRAGKSPSIHAWPQLLGQKTKRSVWNQSAPGASNKEIWWTAKQFEYKPTDKVIVAWTFMDRWCIIKKDFNDIPTYRIGAWQSSQLSNMYYKSFYDYFDMQQDFICRYENLNQFFQNRNIDVFNLTFDTYNIDFYEKHTPGLYPLRLPYIDKGLDGGHPGLQTNRNFAEHLFNILETAPN